MKIVVTANTTWNLVNFRSELMRRLANEGHQVVAAAPPDETISKLQENGFRYVRVPMDQRSVVPFDDAKVIIRYLRVLKEEAPDLVLSFTPKANIYGALAARTLGISFLPNVSGLGTAFLSNRWIEVLVTRLYRAAFRSLPLVFFQNTDDRDLFVKKNIISFDQTRLLPGSGVDLKRFAPDGKEISRKSATVFLLVARLLNDKGVREFVEAARMFRGRAQFQLLGQVDSPNRTAISRQTVDQWVAEGVVEYLGVTDDVRCHIQNADCIVLPSYREGTPRSLLEGAAMGKPLIATDVPGCREVVDNGANGFLCEAHSASDLANKFEAFLSLNHKARRKMAVCSRQLVEARFDEKFVVDAYLQALGEVQ